jgi:hypothetical protein
MKPFAARRDHPTASTRAQRLKSTLNGHSGLRQQIVGSARKRVFVYAQRAADFELNRRSADPD